MAQRHMYVRQSLITAKKSKTAAAMHHKGAWLFAFTEQVLFLSRFRRKIQQQIGSISDYLLDKQVRDQP